MPRRPDAETTEEAAGLLPPNEATQEADPAPAPAPAPASPAPRSEADLAADLAANDPTGTLPAADLDGFLLGQWGGMPRYQCAVCAFDTLDRERARDHAATAHAPTPPPAAWTDTGLVDRFGNPIVAAPA